MNVTRLVRRRRTRAGLVLGMAVGWVIVAIGAIVDGGALIAIGAALTGAANLAIAKLTLETRSDVHAVGARNRLLAVDLDRSQRSLTTRLDRLELERERVDSLRRDLSAAEQSFADWAGRGDEAIGQLAASQNEIVERLAASQSEAAARAIGLGEVDDALRIRLERLEEAHGTTVDALSLTRTVVDKLAVRVPTGYPAERLARLARNHVEHPLLSIAIPSFNRPGFLAECLESVEREISGSFEDAVEVCIMDDASSDPDTLEIAAAFAERCRFVSVRRQERNVGIERNVVAACQPCRGEFLLVLGNDDVVVPGAVATVLRDLRTVAAPVHLYEKKRITVDGAPRDAVPGTSPLDLPAGEGHLFGSYLEAARRQGFISTFGFVSHLIFKRTPFVAVDPAPYYDLTMYAHVFALLEAFGDDPVFYRNEPIVLHRSPPQSHKLVEALGRREAVFMTGGPARQARYFGTTMAAAWQRVIDRSRLDPAILADQPESLLTQLPLPAWIALNRAVDVDVESTLDPLVVADAERFLAAFDRESIA